MNYRKNKMKATSSHDDNGSDGNQNGWVGPRRGASTGIRWNEHGLSLRTPTHPEFGEYMFANTDAHWDREKQAWVGFKEEDVPAIRRKLIDIFGTFHPTEIVQDKIQTIPRYEIPQKQGESIFMYGKQITTFDRNGKPYLMKSRASYIGPGKFDGDDWYYLPNHDVKIRIKAIPVSFQSPELMEEMKATSETW